MIISVIGSGSASHDALRDAEQVGVEIAKLGHTVVCGGTGGVMAAVCKGAKSAGGTTIGILSGNDPKDANEWVDYAIPTGMGHARNALVVKTGRSVIAVSGAYGTLSEIGLALSENRPVIGLGTWQLSRNGNKDQSIVLASNPADAVEKAVELAQP